MRDLQALLVPSIDPASEGFNGRPLIMGILNVTPDSFSDGGDFLSTERALEHALSMIEEGADIIDIGGESTRPPGSAYGSGADTVDESEEMRRVLPVIKAVRNASEGILLSIDTTKATVARSALDAGADIVNDVSAASADVSMLSVVASKQAPLILMHGNGPLFQKARIEEYRYSNVVEEVMAFLSSRIAEARRAGIATILADVGVGFAKTYEDNLRLIRSQRAFLSLGVPLVLGVSRKSTIGRAQSYGLHTKLGSSDDAAAVTGAKDPKQRLFGSIAAACYAVQNGVQIVRTHDVRATREALAVTRAIMDI